MVAGKKHKALHPFNKRVMFNLFSPLAAERGAEAAAPAWRPHRTRCSKEAMAGVTSLEISLKSQHLGCLTPQK